MPEYRIAFKLHENGLTRDLLMDYGDFSMTGKLVDLACSTSSRRDLQCRYGRATLRRGPGLGTLATAS